MDKNPARSPTDASALSRRNFLKSSATAALGTTLAATKADAETEKPRAISIREENAKEGARDWLAFRFPALATAPLLESRVCQYENSPDHHYLLDRHPAASNVWIVGGGSGHGFKQGPAMGERVAKTVLGQRPVDPFFGLARLANLKGRSG